MFCPCSDIWTFNIKKCILWHILTKYSFVNDSIFSIFTVFEREKWTNKSFKRLNGGWMFHLTPNSEKLLYLMEKMNEFDIMDKERTFQLK